MLTFSDIVFHLYGTLTNQQLQIAYAIHSQDDVLRDYMNQNSISFGIDDLFGVYCKFMDNIVLEGHIDND